MFQGLGLILLDGSRRTERGPPPRTLHPRVSEPGRRAGRTLFRMLGLLHHPLSKGRRARQCR
eukprot:9777613-Alexandrium_andersonii.AAC.1